MRALALDAVGGIDHLAVRELPRPELEQPSDVLVRVHAAALNRLDLFVAGGLPGVNYSFPHIVGSDGAGVVEAVGPSVSRVRLGDRVMINPGISCGRCPACAEGEESLCPTFRVIGEHRAGTAAEYVVVPEENLAPVPERMPWAEAAAFTLATLTAWRMLDDPGPPPPGRDGADLGHRRRSGPRGAPDRAAPGRAGDRHQRVRREAGGRAAARRGGDDQPRHRRRRDRGPAAHGRPRRRRRARQRGSGAVAGLASRASAAAAAW